MKKRNNLILLLTISAISAALYVILDQLLVINIATLKITLNALPLIIVTLLYGTKTGFITAILATFISQVIGFGIAPLTILWMLPEIIRVLIVGIFNKKTNSNKIIMTIVIILSSIIITMINTGVIALDALIYNYYSKAYVFGNLIFRIIAGIISGIIYAIICPIIVNAIKPQFIKKGEKYE